MTATLSIIEIRAISDADPLSFAVTVREEESASHHAVTMSAAMASRFARPPKEVVEAAFRFLLDRESKESVLSRFDLSAVNRYFPEFERELPRYLALRQGDTM